MTDRVPSDQIERIVGHARHARAHYARVVSAEQTVYILHSQVCLEDTPDLRDCPFSLALDRGIDMVWWKDAQDRPVLVQINRMGQLIPGPIVGGNGKHNHVTRDIKPPGKCPACDYYWSMPEREYPCTTPGCTGDGRYAAPGRGHVHGCTYPLNEENQR